MAGRLYNFRESLLPLHVDVRHRRPVALFMLRFGKTLTKFSRIWITRFQFR